MARATSAELSEISNISMPLEQEDYGGTFRGTIDEFALCHPDDCLCLAYYRESNPIGLVLLKVPPASPEWVQHAQVSMHGLKVAPKIQGTGLGKHIFEESLKLAASRFPDAKELVLAVDATNVRAKAIYLALDPLDSGPVFRGRMGMEHRMRFDITVYRNRAVTV